MGLLGLLTFEEITNELGLIMSRPISTSPQVMALIGMGASYLASSDNETSPQVAWCKK